MKTNLKPNRLGRITLLAGTILMIAQPGLVQADLRRDVANGPVVQIFSSTIVEDIKQTEQAATAMENGIQSKIADMDKQMALIKASQCEQESPDPGCAELNKQLTSSYLAMLDVMATELPTMEQAIERSRASLERRLRGQLGKGASASKLQEILLGDSRKSAKPLKRAGGERRLSQRFRQYYELVAGGSGINRGSLTVVAADIYLEMGEAQQLIAMTQDEINRARLVGELGLALPGLTPQMEQTVAGVKGFLFGESEANIAIANPPVGSSATTSKARSSSNPPYRHRTEARP